MKAIALGLEISSRISKFVVKFSFQVTNVAICLKIWMMNIESNRKKYILVLVLLRASPGNRCQSPQPEAWHVGSLLLSSGAEVAGLLDVFHMSSGCLPRLLHVFWVPSPTTPQAQVKSSGCLSDVFHMSSGCLPHVFRMSSRCLPL